MEVFWCLATEFISRMCSNFDEIIVGEGDVSLVVVHYANEGAAMTRH
jgi:hypothetical protein